MSLTVNIYYTGSGGSSRKFAEEMTSSVLVEAIRVEEGNEKDAYYFPAVDPETVLLIDRWRDQAALDIHHKTPMMAQIAALRKKYNLKMRVERYVDAPKNNE